ncbi:hypothetical protein [Brevibacterium limosum]|uniref:hypothetical protein n=1 Tax=Brevibacterium limosum TaxID=2697565 RepID=UPI001423A303|nr:hypothetical protein [Brevibacterium limosum]
MPMTLGGGNETPLGRSRFSGRPIRAGEGEYSLVDDREAAAFELRLAGEVVAALHYRLDEVTDEAAFVYCEIAETLAAAQHCKVLLRLATRVVEDRGMAVAVTYPVALRVREFST